MYWIKQPTEHYNVLLYIQKSTYIFCLCCFWLIHESYSTYMHCSMNKQKCMFSVTHDINTFFRVMILLLHMLKCLITASWRDKVSSIWLVVWSPRGAPMRLHVKRNSFIYTFLFVRLSVWHFSKVPFLVYVALID